MLRRFMPQTVVGQLMTMLAIVLLVAQIFNLALLVGEQRIQARSKTYNKAIEYSASLIADLPVELPTTLPYRIPTEQNGSQGIFFLSNINRANQVKGIAPLPRYNQRFLLLLKERGVTPIQTSVTFSSKGPRPGGPKQFGDQQADGFLDDRPPRGQFEKGRRPPPPRGGPRAGGPPQDGAFREIDGPGPGAGPGPGSREFLFGVDRQARLQEILLSAEIKDGVWFNAMMPHYPTESLTGRILLSTALLLGLALLAAWLFARRISRPLSEFTKAAEQLGRGNNPVLLTETGPTDLRHAAIAFNTMQGRLTRMLDTQRTMLRAVGHDLRTPLTSLRIRAENIPEDQGRDKFISTLNDMTVMTEEILSWAKDASGTEDLAAVDLEAMLSSLTDDYQDQGRDVSLRDFKSVTLNIRRISIKRALQNLINNAVQYGEGAELSVEVRPSMVFIHVDDMGPGVPEEQLGDILKPFVRLEASRNKETGGTGLGLSITETIAQIHGGNLTLKNKKPKGLRATLSLPF